MIKFFGYVADSIKAVVNPTTTNFFGSHFGGPTKYAGHSFSFISKNPEQDPEATYIVDATLCVEDKNDQFYELKLTFKRCVQPGNKDYLLVTDDYRTHVQHGGWEPADYMTNADTLKNELNRLAFISPDNVWEPLTPEDTPALRYGKQSNYRPLIENLPVLFKPVENQIL